MCVCVTQCSVIVKWVNINMNTPHLKKRDIQTRIKEVPGDCELEEALEDLKTHNSGD